MTRWANVSNHARMSEMDGFGPSTKQRARDGAVVILEQLLSTRWCRMIVADDHTDAIGLLLLPHQAIDDLVRCRGIFDSIEESVQGSCDLIVSAIRLEVEKLRANVITERPARICACFVFTDDQSCMIDPVVREDEQSVKPLSAALGCGGAIRSAADAKLASAAIHEIIWKSQPSRCHRCGLSPDGTFSLPTRASTITSEARMSPIVLPSRIASACRRRPRSNTATICASLSSSATVQTWP